MADTARVGVVVVFVTLVVSAVVVGTSGTIASIIATLRTTILLVNLVVCYL